MRRTTGACALFASAALLATTAISPTIAADRADPDSHHGGGHGGGHHGGGHHQPPQKTPTQVGYGGAVSTVDPEASRIALKVLRRGGNATDAAIAAAAALGVTEPYSAGIGGGGYIVRYDGRTGRVSTIDGRETAPAAMEHDAFIDPATGEPYPFTPELVTSGVSVGVPGTLATWDRALRRWGTHSLARALRPATRLARKGFVVDETFRKQTLDNAERFGAFTSTRDLYLPNGDAPKVGTKFRNPDLARTYRILARHGMKAFYRGPMAQEIVEAVQDPPKTDDTELPVPVGSMETSDLANYRALNRRPTKSSYRGHDVYGMAESSSGGTTIGEALNILEQFDVGSMSDADALHHYVEASALAFADRGAYVGDPSQVDVPVKDLLSDKFAKERACQIDPTQAQAKPVAEGDVSSYDGKCDGEAKPGVVDEDTENISTTNMTVSDRWGNVVEYTLTIEQTGGSGIVVPGRGFLLNNELTDFSTVYDPEDPNRIEPGKRPRSSMSPTIVLKHGKPFLALGTPGGSTIITTVLQMLFNRIDRDMTIEEAIAAPRAAQRNTTTVTSEPDFMDAYEEMLNEYGHTLRVSGDILTGSWQIGAATAIEFGRHGKMTAVAEPTRRGGGAALVVKPRR
ncbi:MAG: gamma-glutamyltransferase [Nocardioides sp.]|nr:gamma-glutamyltransferase [Nocardioides sp.]